MLPSVLGRWRGNADFQISEVDLLDLAARFERMAAYFEHKGPCASRSTRELDNSRREPASLLLLPQSLACPLATPDDLARLPPLGLGAAHRVHDAQPRLHQQ